MDFCVCVCVFACKCSAENKIPNIAVAVRATIYDLKVHTKHNYDQHTLTPKRSAV